jgi:hypothetical protein
MLPWLSLNYTAARLAFEAQNAAFRFFRLSGGITKTSAADEIDLKALVPPASTTPAPVVVTRRTRHAAKPTTRHAAKKIARPIPLHHPSNALRCILFSTKRRSSSNPR